MLIDALSDGDVNTAHRIIDRKEGSKLALTGAVNVVIAGKDAEV